MSLFAELQRRKVFKVAAAYVVVAWLVIQVAATVFPAFGIPAWALRLVTLSALLGFPLALVLAWVLDVTPEGIRIATGETGNKRFFLAVTVLTVAGVAWYLHGRAPVAPVDVVAERSIAVLPFVNMSADPNQEFFSDGIAEELLNRLAKFTDLKVAARTSAFQFKGRNLDIGEIGRRLKVAHVLEGSVRKSGARLRITAQLIDSRSGYHLWSETYDRDAADVFKVQDEIAGAIAEALEARLGGRPAASKLARTVSPAAYDDYLQGRSFIARRRVENLDKAILAFDRAIAQDPDYSDAHSGRAFALLLRPLWDADGSKAQALLDARTSAEKALQLDPDNAEAYMVRGMAAFYGRHATAAAIDLDRAQALAPGNVDVLNMIGDFQSLAGDLAAAERNKRKAMALDPLSFVHPMNLADVLTSQARYADAVLAANQAVALGGGQFAYDRLVFAYARLGRVDDLKAVVEKGCAIDPASLFHCQQNRSLLLAVGGQRQQAKALLDKVTQQTRPGDPSRGVYDASAIALSYLDAGDIAKATQWQRKVLDDNNWFPLTALCAAAGGAKLPEEISRDRDWLAVWDDPRVQDMMVTYRRNLLAWRASR